MTRNGQSGRQQSEGKRSRRLLSLAHANFPDIAPPRFVEIAASAGYDAVGLRIEPVGSDARYPMTPGGAMFQETAARLADAGMSVLDIEVFRLMPGPSFSRYEAALETCAGLAAANLLVTCDVADAAERCDLLAEACSVVRPYGMNLALEFKPWDSVSTASIATDMVGSAAADNAKVLVDTLHVHRGAVPLEELEALPRSFVSYLQICDAAGAPASLDDIVREARHARLAPGEGEIDLAAILSRLPADVPISVEIQNDLVRWRLGEGAMARLGLETTRAVLEWTEAR